MQSLAIINRVKIECNLYKDGRHDNVRNQLRNQRDLDVFIAKLLNEGWRLFSVGGDDMYFVYEPPSASPFFMDNAPGTNMRNGGPHTRG